jgi:ATP-dependent RNA helicase RhlE
MICNSRDRKNFSSIEALLQKEIPRTNFSDDDSSSKQNENENLKSKSVSADEYLTRDEENKSKNSKKHQKSENNNRIIGLGEHTPVFLSQSFNDRLAS